MPLAVFISGQNMRVDSYTLWEPVTSEIITPLLEDICPCGPIQVTFTQLASTTVSTAAFSVMLQLRVALVPIYVGGSVVTVTMGDGTVE